MFKKLLVFLLCLSISGCLIAEADLDKSSFSHEEYGEPSVPHLKAQIVDIKKELVDLKEEVYFNFILNELSTHVGITNLKYKHSNLIKKFKKATVRLSSVCKNKGKKTKLLGSGVVIKSKENNSYIMTAAHVVGLPVSASIRNGINITECGERCVYLSDDVLEKNCIKFNLVISDIENDFSLIKVNKDLRIDTRIEKNWTIGDEVFIVGFPVKPHFQHVDGEGFPRTTITVDKSYIYRKELYDTGEFTGRFYMNEHSNGGISGGPLFNSEGDLIGISQNMILPKYTNRRFGANLVGAALDHTKEFFAKHPDFSFIVE